MVSLEELKKNYAVVNDKIYGECLVIPSASMKQFERDWDEKLTKEGCKIFQGSVEGRAAFFVRLPKSAQGESAGPRAVYAPTPPTREPPLTQSKSQKFLGKQWTREEDAEIIKGVTLDIQV